MQSDAGLTIGTVCLRNLGQTHIVYLTHRYSILIPAHKFHPFIKVQFEYSPLSEKGFPDIKLIANFHFPIVETNQLFVPLVNHFNQIVFFLKCIQDLIPEYQGVLAGDFVALALSGRAGGGIGDVIRGVGQAYALRECKS